MNNILADTVNVAVKLFFALKMLGTKGCGREDTNNDGLHITDKLFAVGLGVGVDVVPVLDPPLALFAAAMLLEAAAEDSATKACEKLAVPYMLWQ